MSVHEIDQLIRLIDKTLPVYTGEEFPVDGFVAGKTKNIQLGNQTFYCDKITLAIIGFILHHHCALTLSAGTAEQVATVINAYKTGRFVQIDGIEYPYPPMVMCVRRNNVCSYIALMSQSLRAFNELGTHIGDFIREYDQAIFDENLCAAPVSAINEYVPVVGTPRSVVVPALAEFYKKTYGGLWKIPGFGPKCAKFCKKHWPDVSISFYNAVM